MLSLWYLADASAKQLRERLSVSPLPSPLPSSLPLPSSPPLRGASSTIGDCGGVAGDNGGGGGGGDAGAPLRAFAGAVGQRDNSAPPPAARGTLAPCNALGAMVGDADRGRWPPGAAKALGGASRPAARDGSGLPSDLPPSSDLPSGLPPRSATSLETVVESGARRGSVRPSSSISCRSGLAGMLSSRRHAASSCRAESSSRGESVVSQAESSRRASAKGSESSPPSSPGGRPG